MYIEVSSAIAVAGLVTSVRALICFYFSIPMGAMGFLNFNEDDGRSRAQLSLCYPRRSPGSPVARRTSSWHPQGLGQLATFKTPLVTQRRLLC
jgi:hypothetical protein